VLIFCGSKAHCEKVAKHIAKHITVPERSKPATAAAAGAAAAAAAAAAADAGGEDGGEAAADAGHICRAQLLTELTRVAAKPDEALKQVHTVDQQQTAGYTHSSSTSCPPPRTFCPCNCTLTATQLCSQEQVLPEGVA
jgi:hypothetical protein